MTLPLDLMPRLVWMVLNDGRSVVAGCGSTTREGLELALAKPDHTLMFTSDDRVDVLPTSAVRDFVLFDARSSVPAASSIYRIVHV
ncbi:MAG: hypothetical protein M3P06_06150 [Acidobacteriota bacterium]|nr:hypothetical protein [Acidobacteriota bacterium]